ncbi:hypothetical protein [Lysinibacillus sphaericus]|nr:hypothetical protein [Lysinibacillus sphaericus]
MRKSLPSLDDDKMKWKKVIFIVIVEGLTVLANELGKRIQK